MKSHFLLELISQEDEEFWQEINSYEDRDNALKHVLIEALYSYGFTYQLDFNVQAVTIH